MTDTKTEFDGYLGGCGESIKCTGPRNLLFYDVGGGLYGYQV